MGLVLDWDGSITGMPMSTVVKDTPFFTSSLCNPKPHWGNMSVCPHRYTGAGGTGAVNKKLDVVLTRDDVPEFPEIALEFSDPWQPDLSTDHSYILSFRNHSLPPSYKFQVYGLDSGHVQQIGFCLPLGVPVDQIEFSGSPKPLEMQSYQELLEDQTGAGYFWDVEVGLVIRKFKVYEPRSPDDRTHCVPTAHSCPHFDIETSHPGDTDCTSRAYPKYKKNPI